MIEHLLRFANEKSAKANKALQPYLMEDEWDQSRVLPFKVILGQTPELINGEEVLINTYAPEFHLRITLSEIDPALEALTNCIIYEGGVKTKFKGKGKPKVLKRKGFSVKDLHDLKMEPEWAGLISPNDEVPEDIEETIVSQNVSDEAKRKLV